MSIQDNIVVDVGLDESELRELMTMHGRGLMGAIGSEPGGILMERASRIKELAEYLNNLQKLQTQHPTPPAKND